MNKTWHLFLFYLVLIPKLTLASGGAGILKGAAHSAETKVLTTPLRESSSVLLRNSNEFIRHSRIPTTNALRLNKALQIPLLENLKQFKLKRIGELVDFGLMDSKWSDKDIYLQREANAAFEKMAEAAQKDGIDLIVVSGTRNFNEQRRIWEKKWMNNPEEDPRKKALEILAFSSMPSTSRHHWGTDIDINSVDEAFKDFEVSREFKEMVIQKSEIN